MEYIKSMNGTIQKTRALGLDGFELKVTVSFDSKEFNRIKKKGDPLAAGMAQIKNVVLDATGGRVRSMPRYAPVSYGQRFPRASKGLVTLELTFDISDQTAKELGVDIKEWSPYVSVDLNSVLEATRDHGHLFAKSAITAKLGH